MAAACFAVCKRRRRQISKPCAVAIGTYVAGLDWALSYDFRTDHHRRQHTEVIVPRLVTTAWTTAYSGGASRQRVTALAWRVS